MKPLPKNHFTGHIVLTQRPSEPHPERKDGALSLRDKTRKALLSIRGLGAKEAREKLSEAEGKRKKKRES